MGREREKEEGGGGGGEIRRAERRRLRKSHLNIKKPSFPPQKKRPRRSQAVARAHRLGQQREVRVFRLVARDCAVEGRVLQAGEEKRAAASIWTPW